MSIEGLPLRPGDTGAAIRDLQARLRATSAPELSVTGTYDVETSRAVADFQQRRDLDERDEVGHATWSALVEASYRLGDRLVYLRTPMLRGDDIEDLQRRLGALGFDAGRVDGIFGPDTERAVKDFQRNVGTPTDGIAGPDTLAALTRLGPDRTGNDAVAQVRELDRLLHTERTLADLRIVVGETGGAAALAGALARTLRDAGATVLTLHDPEWSTQAREANQFGAEVFLGLTLKAEQACHVSYFRTEGFYSVGGAQLAELCASGLSEALATAANTEGRRLPVLRETRMPAVLCQVGPAGDVVHRTVAIATVLRSSVETWTSQPIAQP